MNYFEIDLTPIACIKRFWNMRIRTQIANEQSTITLNTK